jgi:hypothetical protein
MILSLVASLELIGKVVIPEKEKVHDYAIILGYRDAVDSLDKEPEKQVEEFGDAVMNSFGWRKQDVNVLNPTTNKDMFEKLLNSPPPWFTKNESRLIVYFCGHGPIDEIGARFSKPDVDREDYVSLRRILELTKTWHAERTWIVLDTCVQVQPDFDSVSTDVRKANAVVFLPKDSGYVQVGFTRLIIKAMKQSSSVQLSELFALTSRLANDDYDPIALGFDGKDVRDIIMSRRSPVRGPDEGKGPGGSPFSTRTSKVGIKS